MVASQRSLFDQTSFAADSPAKTFRWLGDVLDWLDRVAGSGLSSAGYLESSVPGGFASKTSPVFYPATKGETCESSPMRWGNWGMGGPIGFLTLNGSEFPSGAGVCSLSDVLETGDVPPKYFLSPTACRGILRRAEKRGRELPIALLRALQQAAESTGQDEGEKTT